MTIDPDEQDDHAVRNAKNPGNSPPPLPLLPKTSPPSADSTSWLYSGHLRWKHPRHDSSFYVLNGRPPNDVTDK